MHDPTGAHDVQADDVRIAADEMALQIVLRNLVDNACRHSEQKLQTLTGYAVAIGSEAVKFTGCDYGTGFQGDASTFLEKGKLRKRAGFVLLGVRRLINARGGTITARLPEAGPGALVKFCLLGKIEVADSI